MTTTIIDYNAGNLTSVRLAFDALDAEVEVTAEPAAVAAAERIVFPGVGAAGSAMAELRERGLVDCLKQAAADGKPFLGICLGTQILLEHSEEDGGTDCLGILPGHVVRFQPQDRYDKVPQMGWNAVHLRRPDHPVLRGIADGSEFYFVHTYYPDPSAPDCRLGETSYAGATFAAVTGRDNLVATQFHPERSGRIGMKLLANFLEWDGSC